MKCQRQILKKRREIKGQLETWAQAVEGGVKDDWPSLNKKTAIYPN
jgi:hypothetical protein